MYLNDISWTTGPRKNNLTEMLFMMSFTKTAQMVPFR